MYLCVYFYMFVSILLLLSLYFYGLYISVIIYIVYIPLQIEGLLLSILFSNLLCLQRKQVSETLFIVCFLFENNTNNLYLFYYLFQLYAQRKFHKLISLNDGTH